MSDTGLAKHRGAHSTRLGPLLSHNNDDQCLCQIHTVGLSMIEFREDNYLSFRVNDLPGDNLTIISCNSSIIHCKV